MARGAGGCGAVAAVAAALCACASLPRAEAGAARARVDAGTYSVVVPAGDGWRVRIDRDEASVLCRRTRPAFPSGIARETRYLVRRKEVPEGGARLGPRALGAALADAEVQTLALGEAHGEYVLREVRRALHRAGGRLVHLVDFEAAPPGGEAELVVRGRLLLYAPPELLAEGVYFVVLVTDAFRRGAVEGDARPAADALIAALRPDDRR